jgi:hypothetical protein
LFPGIAYTIVGCVGLVVLGLSLLFYKLWKAGKMGKRSQKQKKTVDAFLEAGETKRSPTSTSSSPASSLGYNSDAEQKRLVSGRTHSLQSDQSLDPDYTEYDDDMDRFGRSNVSPPMALRPAMLRQERSLLPSYYAGAATYQHERR